MSIAKVIEVIGESSSGWEDAVRNAVQNAARTIDNITGVEVMNLTANVVDGEVKEYKANVKLAFGIREER